MTKRFAWLLGACLSRLTSHEWSVSEEDDDAPPGVYVYCRLRGARLWPHKACMFFPEECSDVITAEPLNRNLAFIMEEAAS